MVADFDSTKKYSADRLGGAARMNLVERRHWRPWTAIPTPLRPVGVPSSLFRDVAIDTIAKVHEPLLRHVTGKPWNMFFF